MWNNKKLVTKGIREEYEDDSLPESFTRELTFSFFLFDNSSRIYLK
jgi:hypothetical protein